MGAEGKRHLDMACNCVKGREGKTACRKGREGKTACGKGKEGKTACVSRGK